MPNENNKTMKSDELIEVDANVLKALQLTRAAFAPLAEIDNADFDALADAVARRAYEIAKLRGLHRKPFFAGQSLSKYFEDLTSLAQVSFSQLLEWLRLRPAPLTNADSLQLWILFSQEVGLEALQTELMLRIELALEINPKHWQASEVKFANGPDEVELLAQCETALREVESRYSDEHTRVLLQLKATVRKVYPEDPCA